MIIDKNPFTSYQALPVFRYAMQSKKQYPEKQPDQQQKEKLLTASMKCAESDISLWMQCDIWFCIWDVIACRFIDHFKSECTSKGVLGLHNRPGARNSAAQSGTGC